MELPTARSMPNSAMVSSICGEPLGLVLSDLIMSIGSPGAGDGLGLGLGLGLGSGSA